MASFIDGASAGSVDSKVVERDVARVIRQTPAREAAAERWLRGALSALLLGCQRLRRESLEAVFGDSVLIIAPHPDDEVLGCGGAALLMGRRGARIRVVFLTDGTASHGDAVDRAMLARRREEEAVKACSVLGIPPDYIHFLALPDGTLMDQLEVCSARLGDLVEWFAPTHVFVPHRLEPPSDHRAARLAAIAALGRLRRPVETVEYAVWCWYEWPFVRLEVGGSAFRRFGRRVKQLGRSLRWLMSCGVSLDVSDVADEKRRALLEHTSQALGLPEAPDAPTLLTLRGGDFVERLLGPREIFRVSRTPGGIDGGAFRSRDRTAASSTRW